MHLSRLLWTLAVAAMLIVLPATLVAGQQGGNGDGENGAPGPGETGDEQDDSLAGNETGDNTTAGNSTSGTGTGGNNTDNDAAADDVDFGDWCVQEYGFSDCQERCFGSDRHAKCMEAFCEAHPRATDCLEHRRMQQQRADFEERRHAARHDACVPREGRTCPAPQDVRPLPPAVHCADLLRQARDRDARGPEAALDAMAACCERMGADVLAARCDAIQEIEESLQQRHFIHFEADAENDAIWNYTVNGQPVLDGLWYAPDGDVVPETTRLPHTILMRFFPIDDEGGREERPDAVVTLHDNPTGLVSYKGEAGVLYLDLPDDATVEERIEGGLYVITYAQGHQARLVGKHLEWDGDVVQTDRFLALHVAPGDIPAAPGATMPAGRGEVAAHIQDALERRHLGATISVQKRATDTAASPEDQDDAPEVLAYDDVDVQLQTPAGPATDDDPLWVEFGAELPEGRTIAIDVDPEVLSAGPDLRLRYYDILYDEAGQRHEVEVLLQQASSIQDVMDPTDDGIQPEYWVVEDEDGYHILLSVPTWSVHALSVASVGDFVVQPSVMAGLMLGLVGTGMAAYGMFRPRRE